MENNYDAIYNAVRSRLSFCDIGQKIDEVFACSGLSFAIEQVKNRAIEAISNCDLPSVIYRPKLYIDGNQWCALYGEDIQSGVCGFGESPSDACFDFNKNWHAKIKNGLHTT